MSLFNYCKTTRYCFAKW